MWVSALGLQCSAVPDQQSPPAPTAAPAGKVNPLGRARCQAPAGVTVTPGTIEESVQLLNALPKPTSVACYVESLQRPLMAFATSSAFSAQPALSTRSPRMFVKLDRLWLSIVIDGESSYLMEFGYLLEGEELRSIKGELLLPISEPLPPSAPYDRVRSNAGTVCGLCHFGEQRHDAIGFAEAYSSIAFRPRLQGQVSLETLRVEHQLCDWDAEPHRCEMLSAVFDGGDVVEAPFPDSMLTFF